MLASATAFPRICRQIALVQRMRLSYVLRAEGRFDMRSGELDQQASVMIARLGAIAAHEGAIKTRKPWSKPAHGSLGSPGHVAC
jgi:hypothetical protein